MSGIDVKVSPCIKCQLLNKKGKEFSVEGAKKVLRESNVELLEGQKFKGRSYEYEVRCKKCGLIYKTTLVKDRVRNCPYCTESKNQGNQLLKLYKICEDNSIEPLFDEYNKMFEGRASKRRRFPVRCKRCGFVYDTTFTGHNIVLCPKCTERGFVSERELQIREYLHLLSEEFISSFRGTELTFTGRGNPFEIDIYLPKLTSGLEFNGFNYHSSAGRWAKSKDYHKLKTDICWENGISLYHFWENEPIDDIKKTVWCILNPEAYRLGTAALSTDGVEINDVNGNYLGSLKKENHKFEGFLTLVEKKAILSVFKKYLQGEVYYEDRDKCPDLSLSPFKDYELVEESVLEWHWLARVVTKEGIRYKSHLLTDDEWELLKGDDNIYSVFNSGIYKIKL